MEQGNQKVAFGEVTVDLSSEGNDGSRNLMGVLTIRAELVLNSQRDLMEQPDESCHLADSIMKMSLSGLDDSSASSSSSHSQARLSAGSNGNYRSVEMCRNDGSYKIRFPPSAPPINLASQVQKQVFEIPLKTIFTKALKSVGINGAVFTCVPVRSGFQVHIELNLDMPLHLGPGSNLSRMTGDVCATAQQAEASAISEAFGQLSKAHNIRLVDISSRKQSLLTQSSRDLYQKVRRGLSTLRWMLEKWTQSLDNLAQVENLVYSKFGKGTQAEFQFAATVYQLVQGTKHDSINEISSFRANLNELTLRSNNYVEQSRCKSSVCPEAVAKKAHFPDVDVLTLLLDWLNLQGCEYTASEHQDGRYTGSVLLSLATPDSLETPVRITARTSKKTVEKAYNCAAREAIFYVESHFNVEVASFNHAQVVLARQEMFLWKTLNDDILVLGSTIHDAWFEAVTKFDQSIKANKIAGTTIASNGCMQGILALLELQLLSAHTV